MKKEGIFNVRQIRNPTLAQGRVDFVRVRLVHRNDDIRTKPIFSGSGLIRLDRNCKGLDKGMVVDVMRL